jgi:lipoyl(octanoyl) transferase
MERQFTSESEAVTRGEKRCRVVELGFVRYGAALDLQRELASLVKLGAADDLLLLLEHPPVLTIGRNGSWANLRVSEVALAQRGIERFDVERGGDVTFHGPGQLVGYPILRLAPHERDVRRYMRNLEEGLIRTLGRYGIAAGRVEGKTGVWTERGKIASLGVHISRWVTRHGFALNVNTDLSCFDLIVPCGIAGCRVVSMESELGAALDFAEVARAAAEECCKALSREAVWYGAGDFRQGLRCSESGAVA